MDSSSIDKNLIAYIDPGILSEINSRKNRSILSKYAFNDENIIRRVDSRKDKATILRSAFDRDIEKILYLPVYNRCFGKTQVFSFMRNDDLTNRGLHIQYVSKISRSLGEALSLNTKLIEAIALGHDVGHPPFGHEGERILCDIYHDRTNRYYHHNVQSVRLLDNIFFKNISLQVLDGIVSHNGEITKQVLTYEPVTSFRDFDAKIEKCYIQNNYANELIPSTLEACVVRISDVIAYLGKDRLDAINAGVIDSSDIFERNSFWDDNNSMITVIMQDIIQNSFDKNYIKLSEEVSKAIENGVAQNYKYIYKVSGMTSSNKKDLESMMRNLYDKLYEDLIRKDIDSYIFRHHCNFFQVENKKYSNNYIETEPNQIVVDFISSMTEPYFLDLCNKCFPGSYKYSFRGYFTETPK